MKNKEREPEVILELCIEDIEELTERINKFMFKSSDDHYMDKNTVSLKIYSNGNINISGDMIYTDEEDITL